MNSLWICGITSTETEKIADLIQDTRDVVDGYVWCVDSDTKSDATFQLLCDNKKDGMIVRHPWQNAHDWQANEWLHCGRIRNGDWVWMFDSSEKPAEAWIAGVREDIVSCEKNGTGGMFMSNRPYLFRFYDHQYFHGTPHWGLIGLVGSPWIIDEDEKSDWVINKRENNPAKHYQEHDTKYYLYGRSNQIQAFYSQYECIKRGIVNHHEAIRLKFRHFLSLKTGMTPSLKALDKLFESDLEDWVVGAMELEFCLTEYYQRTVLKMDFMKDIVPKRYCWSIKQHLKNGDGFSDPSFVSTKMRYESMLKLVNKSD